MCVLRQVKEVRSFTKPNDGFISQLRALDDELFGAKKKDNIEDAFTLKKRKEIEAEKAALKNNVKLKDRVKMFANQENEHDERSNSPLISNSPARVKWNPESNNNNTNIRNTPYNGDQDSKFVYKHEVGEN